MGHPATREALLGTVLGRAVSTLENKKIQVQCHASGREGDDQQMIPPQTTSYHCNGHSDEKFTSF